MSDEATKILDTTTSDTGSEVTIPKDRRDKGRRAFVQAKLGSGDTVLLKGKVAEGLTYEPLATFDGSADNPNIQCVDLPRYVQAVRSVDGGTQDSQLWLDAF